METDVYVWHYALLVMDARNEWTNVLCYFHWQNARVYCL